MDQILLRAESGNVPTRTIFAFDEQYSPLSFEPDGRPSLGVEANPIDVRDASEIEGAVRAFARSPNGCLIVTASPLAVVHRELIVTLAARHRLPAVYFEPHVRQRRRAYLLWAWYNRSMPASGRLCRSHPQGREPGEPNADERPDALAWAPHEAWRTDARSI